MQIDFQPPYHWQEMNEKAALLLGIQAAGGGAQLFAGLGAALSELALGLLKQFPHKNKICFVKGFDPSYEGATTLLSREGCALHSLEVSQLNDPQALDTAIPSDALFVLASEDDPLLGKLLDLSHLEKVTDAKKVTLLRVSHAHHRFLALPDSFTRQKLRVHSLGPRLAMVLYSARMKWPSQFAESVALPLDTLAEVERLKKQEPANPSAIEQFESSLPGKAVRVFSAGEARIPDRAVLYWPDLDGFAVVSYLCKRLGLLLPAPGESTKLETTSLNRWRGVRTMDWLRSLGFTDEMIRGTVIFDHKLLDNDLITHLEAALQEIRSVQGGG